MNARPPDRLEFQGSEVRSAELGDEGLLTLVLSAAAVSRADGRTGHLRPVLLRLEGARIEVDGRLDEAFGTIAWGRWRAATGPWSAALQAPGRVQAPVRLELRLGHGTALVVEAVALEAVVPDGARFMESWAC